MKKISDKDDELTDLMKERDELKQEIDNLQTELKKEKGWWDKWINDDTIEIRPTIRNSYHYTFVYNSKESEVVRKKLKESVSIPYMNFSFQQIYEKNGESTDDIFVLYSMLCGGVNNIIDETLTGNVLNNIRKWKELIRLVSKNYRE